MNEKDIMLQLHSLRNIEPDSQWKANNRQILLSQVSVFEPESLNWMEKIFSSSFFDFIVQPVGLVGLILFLLASGAGASFFASRDTKPGDSLYIAKLLGERTRSSLTFNEARQTKLSLEFASNRAKEITQVLAESNGSEEEKKAQVDKLADNFQDELRVVKNKIGAFTPTQTHVAKHTLVQAVSKNASTTNKDIKVAEKEIKKEGDEVFGATSGRDNSGTQVSEGQSDPKKVIEEAEKLFDKKDYDGAANKLDEVNELIDKVTAQGEMTETASTSK